MDDSEQRRQVESMMGQNFTAAMLSPCVGGILRTWTWREDGEESGVLLVPEADRLREFQGVGLISRTPEGPNGWGTGMSSISQPVGTFGSYRETALLSAADDVLIVQPRVPTKVEVVNEGTQIELPTQIFQLRPLHESSPKPSSQQVWEDLKNSFDRAIWHAVDSNEVLSIELGGWQSSHLPYCHFLLMVEEGELVVKIEAEPAPTGSKVWAAGIRPDTPSATVSSPANQETIGVASIFLMEALRSWGVNPWEIALTFRVLPDDWHPTSN